MPQLWANRDPRWSRCSHSCASTTLELLDAPAFHKDRETVRRNECCSSSSQVEAELFWREGKHRPWPTAGADRPSLRGASLGVSVRMAAWPRLRELAAFRTLKLLSKAFRGAIKCEAKREGRRERERESERRQSACTDGVLGSLLHHAEAVQHENSPQKSVMQVFPCTSPDRPLCIQQDGIIHACQEAARQRRTADSVKLQVAFCFGHRLHHRLGALERRPSGSSSPFTEHHVKARPLGSLGGSSPIQDLLDQIVACASASATLRLCAVGMLIHLTSAGPTEREASSASLLSSPWVRICQGQSFKRSSKLERAEATEPLKPWPGLHFRTSKAFKGVREQRGAKRTKSPTLLVKLWV